MSEKPNNAFRALRKAHKDLKKQLNEREAREQRIRVAYAMAKKGGFPDPYTRLMIEVARERDIDLKEAFTDITEILAEDAPT